MTGVDTLLMVSVSETVCEPSVAPNGVPRLAAASPATLKLLPATPGVSVVTEVDNGSLVPTRSRYVP